MAGTRLRHPRGLPLPGLLVMVVAGLVAGPYTPSWFDPDDPCPRGSPCPGDAESALVLRFLSWVTWSGAVLTAVGVALAAWVLTRRAPADSPRRPSHPWGVVAHVCIAGVVTSVLVAVSGVASLIAALGVSELLGLATLAGSWVLLGHLLDALDRDLGRQPGAGMAYLSSLAVAGLAALATVAVVVAGRGDEDYWSAVAAAGLVAAAATLLTDVVPWERWPAARVLPAALAGATAASGLGAALGALGLLHPAEQPQRAARPVESAPPPPAQPPSPTSPAPAHPGPIATTADPGVPAREPCAPTDLRLELVGFDAAMGARSASLRATNSSSAACHLDGFAAVSLEQAGRRLDLTSGTTSSERPGAVGRATRVGLAPGDAASAALYWRGYGAAADTTAEQTLQVTLRPGTRALSLAVGPQRFDLVDGGELRVGNWVADR